MIGQFDSAAFLSEHVEELIKTSKTSFAFKNRCERWEATARLVQKRAHRKLGESIIMEIDEGQDQVVYNLRVAETTLM
jgi:hypothetical protein